MNINWDSILGKYKAFIESDEGQKRAETAISSGSGNGFSPSNEYMIEAANTLIKFIQEEFYNAYTYDSADSVRKIIDNDLIVTMMPVKIDKGKNKGFQYQLDIGFADESALRRESLLRNKYSGGRTGRGIDNIISLYDTGGGSTETFGYWETRSDWYRYDDQPPFIKTPVPVFDKTGFILAAVEEFNKTYGEVYNCVATISAPDSRFYVRA